MTIKHSTGARSAIADLIDDRTNAGSTDAQGDLVVYEDSTELARFNLQDPAFGSASNGVITLLGTTLEVEATTSGVANRFEIQNKDNEMVFEGTITASGGGGDAEIDDTSITEHQTVRLVSLSYEAAQ